MNASLPFHYKIYTNSTDNVQLICIAREVNKKSSIAVFLTKNGDVNYLQASLFFEQYKKL